MEGLTADRINSLDRDLVLRTLGFVEALPRDGLSAAQLETFNLKYSLLNSRLETLNARLELNAGTTLLLET
jgi:hypothetical protein